jgi:hypothetical protein
MDAMSLERIIHKKAPSLRCNWYEEELGFPTEKERDTAISILEIK